MLVPRLMRAQPSSPDGVKRNPGFVRLTLDYALLHPGYLRGAKDPKAALKLRHRLVLVNNFQRLAGELVHFLNQFI